MGLLDIGAGRIVIGALAAKAFPEKSDVRHALDKDLKDLWMLNQYSHHREDPALDWGTTDRPPAPALGTC